MLKNIAQVAGKQESLRDKGNGRADGSFDLAAYLNHYHVDVVTVKPHGDAVLYCLQECIFDASHSDNEAAIRQGADGKLSYQCFHNSCKGRTWAKARQVISGAARLEGQEDKAKPTQAEPLIKLAGDAELFHDVNRKGYATIPVDGHMETWPIWAKGFKSWLLRRFYQATGKAPGSQAMQDALGLLEAQAHFDGPQHEVYVLVAHAGGKIYLDLANDSWQVVEITSSDPPL